AHLPRGGVGHSGVARPTGATGLWLLSRGQRADRVPAWLLGQAHLSAPARPADAGRAMSRFPRRSAAPADSPLGWTQRSTRLPTPNLRAARNTLAILRGVRNSRPIPHSERKRYGVDSSRPRGSVRGWLGHWIEVHGGLLPIVANRLDGAGDAHQSLA